MNHIMEIELYGMLYIKLKSLALLELIPRNCDLAP